MAAFGLFQAPPPQNPIQNLVDAAAARYRIPAELARAVANQESGYNPNATSPVGAGGVMQLMPGTARGLGVTNVYDPVQNIDAGVRMLSQLVHQYGGNIPLALAAYNAGPGAVAKYHGIPPYAETQNYVRTIMAAYGGQPLSAPTGAPPAAGAAAAPSSPAAPAPPLAYINALMSLISRNNQLVGV